MLVTAQGIGAVGGGLLSSRLVVRLGHVGATVLALFLFGAGLAIMVLAPTIGVLLVGVVPLGFGLPVAFVAINTLIQVRTPNRLMARVSTTTDAIVGIPQVVAIAVGSALVLLVDYHVMLAAMATAMFLIAVALTTWARVAGTDTRIRADASAVLDAGR